MVSQGKDIYTFGFDVRYKVFNDVCAIGVLGMNVEVNLHEFYPSLPLQDNRDYRHVLAKTGRIKT
ncbi:unannotated protein [freshwater metagenome]|uniref:Unannotated protein n=1 Tax=freshwater metagenome TaxID=449393 RepID=A0A6J6P004_9ZZZZ